MNLKSACLCTVVLIGLGLGNLHGQMPPSSYSSRDSLRQDSLRQGPTTLETPPSPPREPAQLSDWIVGCRPGGCCGPIGHNGPLAYELYLRSGASVLMGNSLLDKVLKTGWMIEGGARVLWFDPEETAAWTLDLGISNTTHSNRNREITPVLRNIIVLEGGFPIRIPEIPVSVSHFNRTFVNAGFGREWYLTPVGCCCEPGLSLRVGTDVGGRWGTGKLTTDRRDVDNPQLPHRKDVMGGVYVSGHSDIEIPCGCCLFQVGLRVEWDYTWCDILQRHNKTDLMDLNLLINLGVRF